MEGVGGKYGRRGEMHTRSERRSLKVRAKSKNLWDRVKVKESRYRPGVAQRVPERLGSQIS
jgi:hypothetical protein